MLGAQGKTLSVSNGASLIFKDYHLQLIKQQWYQRKKKVCLTICWCLTDITTGWMIMWVGKSTEKTFIYVHGTFSVLVLIFIRTLSQEAHFSFPIPLEYPEQCVWM